MAVYNSTPPLHPVFSHVLDNPAQAQSHRLDSTLTESQLGTCEYQDNVLGCDAVATVTELESQRQYCLRHFSAINLNGNLMNLPCREPVLPTTTR